jgi:hypothetical protein
MINRMIVAGTLAVAGLASAEALPLVEEEEHECTSWMIFSDLTDNNSDILHKNRDAKSRNIGVVMSQPDSPRKWVGLGNMPGAVVCMGMNASGLAGVMNSGEKCTVPSNPESKGTPAILKQILEHCDTASQAVSMLEDFIAKKDYSHWNRGSIFFFMDLKEGYIVELCAEFCSPVRYDHGYTYRANIWHNPDMAAYSLSSTSDFLNSCNREYMVFTAFNSVLHAKRKITVQDSIALTRNNVLVGSPIERTVCSKSTNSASTLEIDKEFPAVLSTAWVLIGFPRHTICVPVPICTETLLPAMYDLTWSKASFDRLEELGPDAEIPQPWLDAEQEISKAYREAQNNARSLLKAGKSAEAIKFLNESCTALWKKAADALQLPQ